MLVQVKLWENVAVHDSAVSLQQFSGGEPFLYFRFLSNENSIIVFTDLKGKQWVWLYRLRFQAEVKSLFIFK